MPLAAQKIADGATAFTNFAPSSVAPWKLHCCSVTPLKSAPLRSADENWQPFSSSPANDMPLSEVLKNTLRSMRAPAHVRCERSHSLTVVYCQLVSSAQTSSSTDWLITAESSGTPRSTAWSSLQRVTVAIVIADCAICACVRSHSVNTAPCRLASRRST